MFHLLNKSRCVCSCVSAFGIRAMEQWPGLFPGKGVERGGRVVSATGGGGSSSAKQTIYKKRLLHVARLHKTLTPLVTQSRTETVCKQCAREGARVCVRVKEREREREKKSRIA